MKYGISMATAVVLLGTSMALAQSEKPDERPNHPGQMRHEMMGRLDLTSQQKADIAKLRATFQKKTIDMRAKVAGIRVDLREQLAEEAPDEATIKRLVSSISEVQQAQQLALVEHLFAVRALLTPEQRKTLKGDLMRIGREGGDRMRGPMRQWRGQEHERVGEGPEMMPGGDFGDLMTPPPPAADEE